MPTNLCSMIALRYYYLRILRRHSSLNAVEEIYELRSQKLTGIELEALISASDHRRAELVHHCRWLKVPASAWRNV
ncbi:MAG: hypothetical protein H6R25_1345 [Proteobacteria bacterium]|nr:hypothetical protein [Pseudomonadota bacterium]